MSAIEDVAVWYRMRCSVACRMFFFSSRRRHTRLTCDWSSDVCSSDLLTYSGELGLAILAKTLQQLILQRQEELAATGVALEIGRARVGKECRSRWSP